MCSRVGSPASRYQGSDWETSRFPTATPDLGTSTQVVERYVSALPALPTRYLYLVILGGQSGRIRARIKGWADMQRVAVYLI